MYKLEKDKTADYYSLWNEEIRALFLNYGTRARALLSRESLSAPDPVFRPQTNKDKKLFEKFLKNGTPLFLEEQKAYTELTEEEEGLFRFRMRNPSSYTFEEDGLTFISLSACIAAKAAGIFFANSREKFFSPSFRALLLILREPGSEEEAEERYKSLPYDYPLFFIMGAPGSGKTTFLLNKAEGKTLVLAFANHVVDSLEYKLRSENSGRKIFRAGEGKNYGGKELRSAGIICATAAQVILHIERFSALEFDTVLIDEAGSVDTLTLLALSTLKTKKLYLAGDPAQLGPVRDENGEDSPLLLSVYDNIRLTYKQKSTGIFTFLKDQWRMPSETAEFVNTAFYGGSLFLPEKTKTDTSRSMFSIDLSYLKTDAVSLSSSRMNYMSALITVSLALIQAEDEESSAGIVTPYRKQKELMEAVLKDLRKDNAARVKIDTIHGYQGSEEDVIFLDLTDTESSGGPGLLFRKLEADRTGETDRMLNAALSRARKKFVLIGDLKCFSSFAEEGTSLKLLTDYMMEKGDGPDSCRRALHLINNRFSGIVEAGFPEKSVNCRRKDDPSASAWKLRSAMKAHILKDNNIKLTYYMAFDSSKTETARTAFYKEMLEKAEKNPGFLTVCYAGGSFKLLDQWLEKHPYVKAKQCKGTFGFSSAVVREAENDILIYGLFHEGREGRAGRPFIVLRKCENTLKFLYQKQNSH